MKFLHITDIHLDHLESTTQPAYVAVSNNEMVNNKLDAFADYYNVIIKENNIDAVLITGDISTSKHLRSHLLFLESAIKAPIYFVLGNHDYYEDKDIFDGKSAKTAKEIGNGVVLTYITEQYQTLMDENKTVGIVGTDGWYDGGYASFYKSDLFMSDFFSIGNIARVFKRVIKTEIRDGTFYPRFSGDLKSLAYGYHYEKGLPGYVGRELKNIAQKFTSKLDEQLTKLLSEHNDIKDIIVLTHVPPFEDNSVYNGKKSNTDWLPYFSNKTLGDYLLEKALANQDIKFTVLCGHSHGEAENKILDNLTCITTPAEYRRIYKGRIVEV